MDKAKALADIAQEIEACPMCKVGTLGKAVPGEGNPDAQLVFLGEAPGKTEAQTGRPFIGRSGKLLRSTLESIGIDAADVYITSPVKYLPDRGTPNKAMILHGKMHLAKQLKVVNPQTVVLMGSTAAIAMLPGKISVLSDHGKVYEVENIRYFLTLHPAAAVRFQKFKTLFVEDFQKLKTVLSEPDRH